MKKVKLVSFLATLFVPLLLSFPVQTHAGEAKEPLNVTISPISDDSVESGYNADIMPGEAREFKFMLSNKGIKTPELILYPSNAKQVVLGGGLSYHEPEVINTDAGLWIRNVPTRITLVEKQNKEVSFQVNVPKDAKPGGYVIGIVLMDQDKAKAPVTSVIQLNVDSKKIKHETYILESERTFTSDKRIILKIPFENKGTAVERVKGKITITNDNGLMVYEKDYEMGVILPGQKTYYVINPEKPLPDDSYVFTANGENLDKTLKLKNTLNLVVKSQDNEPTTFIDPVASKPKPISQKVEEASSPKIHKTPWFIYIFLGVGVIGAVILLIVTRKKKSY